MKILISESQYYRLFETTDLEFGEPTDLTSGETNNYIYDLCQKREESDTLPYCQLYEFWKTLTNQDEKDSLNESVRVLYDDVTSRLGNGILPKIIKSALDSNNIVQYLKTISDFIHNADFNEEETRKRLSKLKPDTSYDDLERVLTDIRYNAYQEYENSFVGEGKVFDKNATNLTLDYRATKTDENSFFNLVKQIKNDETKKENITNEIIKHIDRSIDEFIKDTKKLKADVKSNQPLLYKGNVIFSTNTYFEIKKFAPNVDSHLSEFFSIFKQSYIIGKKSEYIQTYNELINDIYKNVKDKHSEFLENIKSKIGGIILDNYTIIKIEDVDLYWSFLGQRKKDEFRLSIRYQLKPDKEIIGYKCNPNSVELEKVKIAQGNRERIGILE